jgi:hypothetical protein
MEKAWNKKYDGVKVIIMMNQGRLGALIRPPGVASCAEYCAHRWSLAAPLTGAASITLVDATSPDFQKPTGTTGSRSATVEAV